jgi:hypothetical protein
LGQFKKDVNFAPPNLQLSVAQLAEQMTLNHRAEGSSPSGETGNKYKTLIVTYLQVAIFVFTLKISSNLTFFFASTIHAFISFP